jgi:hypothetical protein
MTYLITQMLACIVAAAVVGFILGWVLRGAKKPKDEIKLMR